MTLQDFESAAFERTVRGLDLIGRYLRPYWICGIGGLAIVAGVLAARQGSGLAFLMQWIALAGLVLAVVGVAFTLLVIHLFNGFLQRPGPRGHYAAARLARIERRRHLLTNAFLAMLVLLAGTALAGPTVGLSLAAGLTAVAVLLSSVLLCQSFGVERGLIAGVGAFVADRMHRPKTAEEAVTLLGHAARVRDAVHQAAVAAPGTPARRYLGVVRQEQAPWPSGQTLGVRGFWAGLLARSFALSGLVVHAAAVFLIAVFLAWMIPASVLPVLPGPSSLLSSVADTQEMDGQQDEAQGEDGERPNEDGASEGDEGRGDQSGDGSNAGTGSGSGPEGGETADNAREAGEESAGTGDGGETDTPSNPAETDDAGQSGGCTMP